MTVSQRVLVLLQERFPGSRTVTGFFKQFMTFFQALALEITRTLDEEVVLKHLLAHRPRYKILVSFRIHLHKPSLLSSNFLKLSKNACWSIVVCSSEKLGSENC
jgi:hypothetical protein